MCWGGVDLSVGRVVVKRFAGVSFWCSADQETVPQWYLLLVLAVMGPCFTMVV